MKIKILRLMSLIIIMVSLLLVISCTTVGELRTEYQSVDLDNAEYVRTEITMGAGELKVAGGAGELLEAEFIYNVVQWKPEVDYRISDNRGYLTLKQPSRIGDVFLTNILYKWNLLLNNEIPMDLDITFGAGNGNLELGSLHLTNLDIIMGAGNVLINLDGSRSLARFDMIMGVGDANVKLTGDWKNDLDFNIKGGVGEATFQLPSDIGVRVDISGGIGKINAIGMKREGNSYVNDAYSESEVTLSIKIQAGVGEINLEMVE